MIRDSSSDSAECLRWAKYLLDGSHLVSFKFDALFSLVFQVERTDRTREATVVLGSDFVAHSDDSGGADAIPSQERPEQAYHLMALVWRQVTEVKIVQSALEIRFAPSGFLRVAGTSGIWDSAWHLGVGSPEINEESVSVDCASDGELFCSWERDG